MKKQLQVIALILFGIMLMMFSGCSFSSKDESYVFSFYGDNEHFSISTGKIDLSNTEQVFNGGVLEVKSDELRNIAEYSSRYYILSGGEEITLRTHDVEDKTGEAIEMSGSLGQTEGDIIQSSEIDNIRDNLYFELKTVDLDDNKKEYLLQLSVTEAKR